jgi:glutathionylspermidine synthase
MPPHFPFEDVGRNSTGQFVDDNDRQIELLFKLYPWEWMTREAFGASLPGSATQFVEPPWKMVLSNKGILPLLWEMYRIIQIYCQPTSATIRKLRHSAPPTFANRSIPVKALVSRLLLSTATKA